MTAQPSRNIVQRPFNPELPLVINLNSQASFEEPPNSNDCGREAMEFLTEKFVDFESLKLNDIDIQKLFYDQQWGNYFDMLNGFVYYDIVKNFWNKATIFDEFNAEEEVRKMVAKDKSLKGKTRVQLGSRPFKGKEIRSNLLGINVLITQEHLAKVLGLDNEGENFNLYKVKSKYADSIREDLYPTGTRDAELGKTKFMKKEFNFAFKVFLASIITREGGKDSISWPHRHFIWFMHRRVKINLAGLLFEHLCWAINESHHKATATIHHPRLISEIIRQTKLIEILRTKEKLRVFCTAKFDATILVNMQLVKKEDLKKPEHPLKKVREKYFWCDGFPTISEHDTCLFQHKGGSPNSLKLNLNCNNCKFIINCSPSNQKLDTCKREDNKLTRVRTTVLHLLVQNVSLSLISVPDSFVSYTSSEPVILQNFLHSEFPIRGSER
ncbi:hypothetical protein QL285_086517 [Trifolium repens]|nr:hypothetical protein QL285_086517 [Trifolium repens]